MAIFRPNFSNPTPSSPFFTPETNALGSAAGPLVVGSGININYTTSTISATGSGGGGGTVTSVLTGPGLTGGPITTTGTISLAASGVLSGSYTSPYITVDSFGRITNASNGPSSVTSVTAGTGLTGGTITGTGTIALNSACVISPSVLAAKGDILAASGPATPVALAVGTNGQALYADSSTSSGLIWCSIPVSSNATPTVAGIVFGCTNSTGFNVALGKGSFGALTSGTTNLALGNNSLAAVTSGQFNVATGDSGLLTLTTGCGNTSVGTTAGIGITTGCGNVIVGRDAGNNITSGSYNLAIGFGVSLALTTGSCQLAIGFSGSDNWLTGNSTKAIKPGAGIIDSANSCGTAGQVLTSTGSNAVRWANAGVSSVTGSAPVVITGTASVPNIAVSSASTSAEGVVQLNNTVTSTSTTLALTAAQGKVLQDQITTLLTSPGIELAGTIDANTGLVASVTSVGATAGYTTGAVLPAASSTTVNTYVIVTTPGTMTPPGGSSTVATRGDWFLASQTAPAVFVWSFLNVGFDTPAASTTEAGIVELATTLETQTGTDSTLAVTPLGAAGTYVPLSAYAAKGSILGASGAGSPVALPVGTNGQVLVACSTETSGLAWAAPSPGTVTCVGSGTGLTGGPITSSGSICLANTAVSPGSYTYGSFTVDQQGRLISASNGTTPVLPSNFTAKGDILAGTAAGAYSALGVGSAGQVLSVDFTSSTNLKWVTPTAYLQSVTGTAPITVDNTSALNPAIGIRAASTTQTGAVQLYDDVDSTSSTLAATAKSVKTAYDQACNAIPKSTVTGKGSLVTGTAASTPSALSVGTNGQVLAADSTCATGLAWVTPCSGTVTSVATGAGLTGGPVTTSGTIALATTAVTPGSYTNATLTVDAYGRLTAVSTGSAGCSGTVTCVATGTGLSGGPVTASGTICLANTAVTPGSYTLATVTVDAQGRITAASSGTPPTGGTVTNVATGTGLTGGPITNTGTIALANTAVTAGSYTYSALTVDAQGRLTAASSGTAPVTSVETGTGLTGGPITTTGTIALANTAVTAGTYTNSTVTVDAQGRLTAASSGTPAVIGYTATKSITSGTPVNLLTWPSTGGFRSGRLWITAYSASLDDWTTAEAIVSGSTSGDTSAVIYWAFGIGTVTIDTTGGATTFVLNPTSTSTNVQISYQYMAGYGSQPTLL